MGGTLLVSYLIVVVNGLALDLGFALRDRTARGAVLAGVGIVGVVLATVVVDVTRFEPTTTARLRVAMLQGDDEQLPLAEQTDQLLTEKHFALADRLRGDYDLIVFPESALDTDPEVDASLRQRIIELAAEHDAAVLVNARTAGDDGNSRNTNLLYTPAGKLQGKYSKQHLVPFGEYVPWRDQLGFLPELRQVPYDFEPGRHAHHVRRGGAVRRQRDLLRVGIRSAGPRLRRATVRR